MTYLVKAFQNDDPKSRAKRHDNDKDVVHRFNGTVNLPNATVGEDYPKQVFGQYDKYGNAMPGTGLYVHRNTIDQLAALGLKTEHRFAQGDFFYLHNISGKPTKPGTVSINHYYKSPATPGYNFSNIDTTYLLTVSGGASGSKGDKGETGPKGDAGKSFLSGTAAPDNGQGQDGDTFLNSTTGDVYTKTNGTWQLSGNLKGPKGDKGDTGAAGKDGATGAKGDKGDAGKSFLSGTAAPDNSRGQDGDTFLNSTTGDVYTKTNGTWQLSGNLKGPKGDQGNAGTPGENKVTTRIVKSKSDYIVQVRGKVGHYFEYVPNVNGKYPSVAPDHTFYDNLFAQYGLRLEYGVVNGIPTITKIYGTPTVSGVMSPMPFYSSMGSFSDSTKYYYQFIFEADSGSGSGGSQGPKGDTGAAGKDGATGAKGDTGAAGKDGAKGADGKSFHTGVTAPDSNLGNNGDSYLNITTGDIYNKTGGQWQKIGELKGPKGEKGDKGDAGVAGKDGDLYYDKGTGQLYYKDNGVWVPLNLKGQKGDTGAQGPKGDTGASGKLINGNGKPNNSQGKDGDLYYDKGTGQLYYKDNGVWVPLNLKGQKGDTGAQGPKGEPGNNGGGNNGGGHNGGGHNGGGNNGSGNNGGGHNGGGHNGGGNNGGGHNGGNGSNLNTGGLRSLSNEKDASHLSNSLATATKLGNGAGKQLPHTGEEALAFLPAVAWTVLGAGVLAYATSQRKKQD